MFESFVGVDFWTALFILLNTLAIFFVAKKYLFVPVKNMIDSRQMEIDTMYAEADAAKEEASALQARLKQELSTAQATSDRLVKEATARAQAREEDILRKANADAAAIMDKAASDIALEKKKALNDAKNEISDLALTIAGKVVERELTNTDQADLIDRFIDGLGDTV